jgi:hypothetical protein
MTTYFRLLLIPIALLATTAITFGQYGFSRSDTIKVTENAALIAQPWVGGLNSSQYSRMDLNFDNIEDLVIFDRTGDKVLTYINNGTPNQVDYTYAPQYQRFFPELHNWMLLVDYNCDGKRDIYSHSPGGIDVYKNTSTQAGGISFQLMTVPYLFSQQGQNYINLYVSQVDIPAVKDIDNDGDLDVLSFGNTGTGLMYHRNLSVENGHGCDSLEYELRNECWGLFSEDQNDCIINLNDTCANFFVSVPELGQVITEKPDTLITLDERKSSGAHVGSTVMALDMDPLGVKEILIGDVSCRNLTLLTNGGTVVNSNSAMSASDNIFPSNSIAVDMPVFPAPFHEDIDNDSILDLIIAPNTTLLSDNYSENVWFYKNIGDNQNPIFSYQQNDLFQEEMIDIGEGALPVLHDYNKDGLMDLFVGNYGFYDDGCTCYKSRISLYKNIGTPTNPEFTLITRDVENISTVGLALNMYPTFGDLDNDGDDDLFIGDANGTIHYFENIAAQPDTFDFVLAGANYTDDVNNVIDVGNFATPQLIDIDRDSDLDLIIGEQIGRIFYYKNIGTVNAPIFRFTSDTLGGFVIKGYPDPNGFTVPLMFEDSASYRLFVGSNIGDIHYYGNIDGNVEGTYTLRDSMLNDINDGVRSAPAVGDLNNDGHLDLIVGNYRGGLSYYSGNPNAVASIDDIENQIDFNLYPNPAKDQINIQYTDQSRTRDLTVMVYNSIGQEVLAMSDNFGPEFTIDVSKIRNGVYICILNNGTSLRAKKFIINR